MRVNSFSSRKDQKNLKSCRTASEQIDSHLVSGRIATFMVQVHAERLKICGCVGTHVTLGHGILAPALVRMQD